MKLKVLILLLTFSLAGCDFFGRQSKEPEHIQAADAVMDKIIKDAKTRYKMKYYGGGGKLLHDINYISLTFELCGNSLELDEVRCLYVDLIERYTKVVNEDERARPYLHHYPFPAEDLRITILLSDKNRDYFKGDVISLVRIGENGEVLYKKFNSQTKMYEKVHVETYEEAKRIVAAGGPPPQG